MSEIKCRNLQSSHSSSHCKVCGDRASGKHYGVPSCDGCRGFFKRSIRRNLEYTCKEGGKCIVDVSRRNQCQACRFAKCLAANMRPEAVQHERAPRSCINNNHLVSNLTSATHLDPYSTRRLPLHPSGLILPIPMHMSTSFPTIEPPRYYPQLSSFHPSFFDSIHFGAANTSMFSKPIPSQTVREPIPIIPTTTANKLLIDSARNIPKETVFGSETPAAFVATTSTTATTSSALGKLVSAVAKEDEVSSSEEIQSINLSAINSSEPNTDQEAVFESAARLLFLAVKWAKSIPSFSQINSHDQILLLEECWAELFVILAAQYGLPITNLLNKSTDVTSRKLRKSIQQILSLSLNHTEYVCLKTLTLFRPDCNRLTSSYEVSMMQDEALNLLLESCGGTRMGHILLTLPHVRSAADRQLIQELLFKRTVGEVAIEKLLGELMRN